MTMQVTRTIKLKLAIPVESILPTITEYTSAYNYVCFVGWSDKDSNGVSLHQKTYGYCRNTSKLPSQLAISSRMRAAESIKSALTKNRKKETVSCPKSKCIAIRLDANSFTIWFERNEVSILTIAGRIKTKITVPQYFQQYVNWKKASADLFIKNKKVYLSIVMRQDIIEIPGNGKVIGIDRGLNKIAVTSDNMFFGGGHIRKVSLRYKAIKAKLQSKGTKSAKRHLKRLSGKANRFKTDVNHCVAKTIVNSVERGSTLVLERLKEIRKKAKLRQKQRTELNSWAFAQLEHFIEYKAEVRNIKVEYICPRYTSQRCNKCGHIHRSNRKWQSHFKCKQCSFQLNADLNASRNIRDKLLDATGYPERAAVNQPIVAANSG
jgi:putative transposase